jgi:hypothetical protein
MERLPGDAGGTSVVLQMAHGKEVQARRISADRGRDTEDFHLLRPLADAGADHLDHVDDVTMLHLLVEDDDRAAALTGLD